MCVLSAFINQLKVNQRNHEKMFSLSHGNNKKRVCPIATRASRAFHNILTDDKLLKAARTDFVATSHSKVRIVYASKKHAINEYAASIGSNMEYTFYPDPSIT